MEVRHRARGKVQRLTQDVNLREEECDYGRIARAHDMGGLETMIVSWHGYVASTVSGGALAVALAARVIVNVCGTSAVSSTAGSSSDRV
jgi:hypothetical protein